MPIHLDITTSTEYSIESSIKINGIVVNKVYFTRNIIKVSPSPGSNFILIVLPFSTSYIVTHNQASESEEVYIIDSINGIVPTSLLDLAFKISELIKH